MKQTKQLKQGPFRFKPTLIPTIATAVLIALFLSLSHWQWSKSDARRTIEAQIEQFVQHAKQTTLTLAMIKEAHTKWQQGVSDASVTFTGQLLQSPIIYWDNRVHQRQSGYHIIALMQHTDSNELLPINLGWHPLVAGKRQRLPSVQLPLEEITVEGTLFVPHANRYVLNKAIASDITSGTLSNEEDRDILLLQRFDAAQLSKHIDRPVLPFIVRTETASAPQSGTPINDIVQKGKDEGVATTQTLIREWPKRRDIGISADKHLGYAVQWLTFAVILAGLYIGLNLERKSE